MYEILEDNKEIERLLIESEGELTPEIEELITVNQNEAQEKMEALYYVMMNMKNKAELEAFHKERFAKREKILKNAAERLKSVLDFAIAKYGVIDPKSTGKIPSKKLNCGTVNVTGVAYPVLDPTTIPPVEKLEEEVPAQFISYTTNIKISVKDKEKAVELSNILSEKLEQPVVIPPSLDNDKVKDALKEKIVVGEIKLLPNYSARFK